MPEMSMSTHPQNVQSDSTGSQAERSNRRKEDLPSLALIGAHLCVTVPLALYLNLWMDEAYTWMTVGRDLPGVIRRSYQFETLPPVYFVLLYLWRFLGTSVPFARLLSVLIVASSLWVAHRASRNWFPNISSIWIVAPLAANPFVIYAATDLRPYCLVIFLSVLLLFLFERGFLGESRTTAPRFLYVATGVVSLYTFYYLGFMLAAGGMILFLERRWRALGVYLGCMAIVAVFLAIEAPWILRSVDEVSASVGMESSATSVVVTVLKSVLALPFGLYYLPSLVRNAVFGAIFLASLYILWGSWRGITPLTRALWCSTAVITAGVILARLFFIGDMHENRHYMVALVPLWFSLVALARLYDKDGIRGTAALCILSLATCGVASYTKFRPLAKGGDYRRVASYLTEHESLGQPILLLRAEIEAPLEYYYDGVNRLAGIPQQDDLSQYVPSKWRIESVGQVRERIREVNPYGGDIWVFTDHRPGETASWYDVDLRFDLFEEVLAEDYEQVERRDFYGATVRLFQSKK